MTLQPGEIYFAEFEDLEDHRVIVVSREEFNRGKYVSVVMCTSKRFRERANLPNCVVFHAGQFGFTRDCVAQAETVGFIEISQLRLEDGPLSMLDDKTMYSMIRALGYVIASDCQPE